MTKTFGAFGATVQEGNAAMMDAIRNAQRIIDGLNTSPSLYNCVQVIIERISVTHAR